MNHNSGQVNIKHLPSAQIKNKLLPSAQIKNKLLPSHPVKNKLYDPSRYKTELCHQYEELGTCEHGPRCLYAHGEHERRQPSGRHPKFKTKLCSAFHEEGFCSFGPRCSFIHSKPDVDYLCNFILNKYYNHTGASDKTEYQLLDGMSSPLQEYSADNGTLNPNSFDINPGLNSDIYSSNESLESVRIYNPTTVNYDFDMGDQRNLMMYNPTTVNYDFDMGDHRSMMMYNPTTVNYDSDIGDETNMTGGSTSNVSPSISFW